MHERTSTSCSLSTRIMYCSPKPMKKKKSNFKIEMKIWYFVYMRLSLRSAPIKWRTSQPKSLKRSQVAYVRKSHVTACITGIASNSGRTVLYRPTGQGSSGVRATAFSICPLRSAAYACVQESVRKRVPVVSTHNHRQREKRHANQLNCVIES